MAVPQTNHRLFCALVWKVTSVFLFYHIALPGVSLAATWPVTTELENYLVVGTDDTEAFLMSNVEIGAVQEYVSDSTISTNQRVGGTDGYNGGLDLESTFFPGDVRDNSGEDIFVPNQNTNGTTGTTQTNNRWNDIDPTANSDEDNVGIPDTLGIAGDGEPDADKLFEGIDWSGEVAITNVDGTFNASNSDTNAYTGIQCAEPSADCITGGTLSDNNAFFDGDNNPNTAQELDPNGISSFDPTALLDELALLEAFYYSEPAELTITADIVDQSFKDGGSPYILDLDALDVNGDGIVFIDVSVDGAFDINNSDVILKTDNDVKAVFRQAGNTTHFDFSNSSIMMGSSDWDLETNPLGLESPLIDELGAVFVMNEYAGENVVFNLNNVILGGVALHDLIDVTGESEIQTSIVMNNAQGCSQFISNLVNMQDNRWNRCSYGGHGGNGSVPEPTTFLLMVLGLLGLRSHLARSSSSV